MEKASSERKEYIRALRFYCSDFFGYSVFGVTIALGSFVFVLIDRGWEPFLWLFPVIAILFPLLYGRMILLYLKSKRDIERNEILKKEIEIERVTPHEKNNLRRGNAHLRYALHCKDGNVFSICPKDDGKFHNHTYTSRAVIRYCQHTGIIVSYRSVSKLSLY